MSSQIRCTVCGADGHLGCEHGAGAYKPLAYFVTKAIEEHPEKSDRAIAEEIGVSDKTVGAVRKELRSNSAVDASSEKRVGRDGKVRRMPKVTRRASEAELSAAGKKTTGEGRVRLDTGEVVSKVAAMKLEAAAAARQEQTSIVIELQAENAKLKEELTERPSMDDLRRMDAQVRHVQRIVTDVDTYNLFRRCLHPDSRGSVTNELLHQAWLAFRNLEALTWDKKTAPPPLPRDLNELLIRRFNSMPKKK